MTKPKKVPTSDEVKAKTEALHKAKDIKVKADFSKRHKLPPVDQEGFLGLQRFRRDGHS